jgi:hypothetical protein
MMKGLLVAAVASAAVVGPATAAADTTPAGPATLLSRWTGPVTAEGRMPEVLVGAKVEVAAGGQAGIVRIRARYNGVTALGDPVTLPAEPGTYTFPLPHIRWDYRGSQIGIDQETGGHAILQQRACAPGLKLGGDPCELERVDVWTPPGAAGEPAEVRKGAKLTLTGVFESDRDEDLVGDQTEDRTDLRVTAVPSRDADGHLKLAVTVTNAGPLAADLPRIESPLGGRAKWDGCKPGLSSWTPADVCALTRLAPGESRTVTATADAPDALSTSVTARAEGPDLADGDNTATLDIPAAPAFTLAAAKSQRLRNGVTVRVRGVHAGRARVTVAFTVRGRTVKLGKVVALKPYAERAVTVRATGAKLRSLRRAAARGELTAEITVRTIGGKTPVTAKTRVVR